MIASDNANDAPPPVPAGRGRDQTKKDKPKESFAIKPEHFEAKKGLKALYENTKQLKLDQSSEINIENTMKKIVTLLKTWHVNMVPRYSFDYFLQRCQVLGSNKRVVAYMSKVRRIHKGLDEWDEPDALNNEQPLIQQNENNNNMDREVRESMAILNPPVRPIIQDDDDDDDDGLMELMYKMEQKAGQKKDNEPEEEFNQPYVPEGYEPPFSEEDD